MQGTKYGSIAVRFERSFTSTDTKSSRAVTIPKEQSYGVLRVRVRKIQISFSLDERARTKYVSVLRLTPTFRHLQPGSDVESRVGVSCTVREKHCTTSSSFPTCKISQGDAELKGFVKCTVLKVGRITPLHAERPNVRLGEHIVSDDTHQQPSLSLLDNTVIWYIYVGHHTTAVPSDVCCIVAYLVCTQPQVRTRYLV